MRQPTRQFDLRLLLRKLESAQDSPLLRLSIALAYQQRHEYHVALGHLEVCVRMAPIYSAAWRLIGNLRYEIGNWNAATEAYIRALACADRQREDQLARELRVRLKRSMTKAALALGQPIIPAPIGGCKDSTEPHAEAGVPQPVVNLVRPDCGPAEAESPEPRLHTVLDTPADPG